MGNEAQDLRRRAEEMRDEPAEAWRPKPGDVLVGELVDIDVRATEHDPAVPVLTMRTDSGELVAVWAFHTVLRSELQKVSPQPGEWLAIRRLEDSERGYKRYRVIPDRDNPRVFSWDRISPDGGDVAPEDRVKLLTQEEESRKLLGTEESDPTQPNDSW